MKRIYTNTDQSRVGMYQSLLEENGIQTLLKNNNAPYKEVWPEAWVVNDDQYDDALKLFKELDTQLSIPVAPWDCPECGECIEEGFGECWNCGAVKAS